MIYTVTFNPAIDYVVALPQMEEGKVNRLAGEAIFFGGKGINVSLVLSELSVPSKALGFVAGFTGAAIESGVRAQGIETDFVHLSSGFSRINVKIKSEKETELNGKGPDIPAEKLEELLEKLDALTDGDTLVLAGSIPSSLPSDMYETILSCLAEKKIRTVVDATGELLLRVLKYRPFLVKPNDHELGALFHVTLHSTEEIIAHAEKLKAMGARNVLVSMAGDGAILLDENGAVHRIGVCRGEVKNSVGAGDSMVAGFLAGCESETADGKLDYAYALKLGTAAGGATAFSEGLAKRELIDTLLGTLSAFETNG